MDPTIPALREPTNSIKMTMEDVPKGKVHLPPITKIDLLHALRNNKPKEKDHSEQTKSQASIDAFS